MGRHKSALYRCHYFEHSTTVNERNEEVTVVNCRIDECTHERRVATSERVQTSQLEAHIEV